MKFWFLDPWDALPGEIGFERGRQIVTALAAAGHEVVWWQTGFAHAEKKSRARRGETGLPAGVQLVLLPARPYSSNVSARRMLSLADYVSGFMRESRRWPRPDGMLVSGPLFFSELALLYLRRVRGIPLVYEFRDLWPETIINSAGGVQQWIRQAAFSPFLFLRRAVFRACDGIVGLNQTYLEIARRESGSRPDLLAAVAYPSPAPHPAGRPSPRIKPPGEIWAISSGTLGASHDHETLLSAAALLQSSHPNLRFLITGAGPYADAIRAAIAVRGLRNVDFLGALPAAEFSGLLRECDIGLALYRRFSPVVFPTKIVDYMLAGLAVVTSAQGEGAAILRAADAGYSLPPEDPAALAAVLQECTADPGRIRSLKTNSARLAVDFHHEKQIDAVVNVLVTAAKNRASTPISA